MILKSISLLFIKHVLSAISDDEVEGIQPITQQELDALLQDQHKFDNVTRPDEIRGAQIAGPADINANKSKVKVLKANNWDMCGYPSIDYRTDLFYVGDSYPMSYKDVTDRTLRTGKIPIERIVGGQQSTKHSWPWQVRVRPCNSIGRCTFLCGGSIISERWVVTAAHCIPYRADRGVITAGAHHLRYNEDPEFNDPHAKNYTIDRVIVHEGWSKFTKQNDIALVHVNQDFNFKASEGHIAPVCLPSSDACLNDHTACAVTGWGWTREGGSISENLQEVAVRIIPHDTCKSATFYQNDVHESQVCAGYAEGGQDSCAGDSGGPLVCKSGTENNNFVLYGLVSWGYGCARQNKPGVYTRIAYFMPWIQSKIALTTGNDVKQLGPENSQCLTCTNHPWSRKCDETTNENGSGNLALGPVVPIPTPPAPKEPESESTNESLEGGSLTSLSSPDSHCRRPTLFNNPGEIAYYATPNWPRNYNNNARCKWAIGDNRVARNGEGTWTSYLKVIKANFGDRRCGRSDKIVVRCQALKTVKILCQVRKPVVLSCPGPMDVEFSSNGAKNYQGAIFATKFVQQELNDCGVATHISIDPKDPFNQNIVSVNPLPPQKTCEFNLSVPEGKLLGLKLLPSTILGAVESRNRVTKKIKLLRCRDKAMFYDCDGKQIAYKACGRMWWKLRPTYKSNCNSMKVILQTDQYNRGQRIDWQFYAIDE